MPTKFHDDLSSQFLVCASLNDFKLKNSPEIDLSWYGQEELLKATVLHPLVDKYPVRISYQVAFLKDVIDHLESKKREVHDDVYSTYCRLLSLSKDEENFYYKHYAVSQDCVISIKESCRFISEGTTGLVSWEASFVLSEWCLQNKEDLKDKNVIELGSGAGLAGFVIGKCCSPKQMWLTDCHTSVLQLLKDNLNLNFHGKLVPTKYDRILHQMEIDANSRRIGIVDLPWEQINDVKILNITGIPDVVLAADVVYDSSVFNVLCEAFLYYLGANQTCRIILVCTVRNKDTLNEFLKLLESNNMRTLQLSNPEPFNFKPINSLSSIKIFQIYSKK